MPNVLDFKQAFISAFVRHQGSLHWAGENQDLKRTTYMQAYIYPTIAETLNMDFLYEFHKVDAILSSDGIFSPDSSWHPKPILPFEDVPLIALEHENNGNNLSGELGNFARLQFPLNVLVTYISSTNVRDQKIFLNRYYIEYFAKLHGRLLIVIDEDMQLSWNVYDHKRGEPLYWAFFLLNLNP
jgi:hypothetical protein